MSEPAKDTAIEITPKPQASSVRVPRIVAEINRVASRVRDRNNREEEEDNDDAEVLENDTPTPSQRPVDIQIIRENTFPRVMQCLGGFVVFLLVLISAQILVLCVFLGRIDENIRSGGGTNTNLLDTSPSPPPASPNQDKSSTNDPELIGVLILLGAILFNVLFFGILYVRQQITRPVQTS